jgi:hypothetical protein
MEVFGILEMVLRLGSDAPVNPTARIQVENQTLAAEVHKDGTLRIRFCPKAVKAYRFEVEGNIPTLHGRSGEILSVAPAPNATRTPAADLPNWWTDDPSPGVLEGEHQGARTVSRWREDFLRDFADRMNRSRQGATN